jgi:hypothetical protein
MKKQYPIHPTKKQLEVMKHYWTILQIELSLYYAKVGKLERDMSKDVGIGDLWFFQCDNDFVGIGNIDRTMELIQREELEKR